MMMIIVGGNHAEIIIEIFIVPEFFPSAVIGWRKNSRLRMVVPSYYE
jgi:hypothetical protein